jgi:two-component system, OmpR family, sensor histidine kinase MprB
VDSDLGSSLATPRLNAVVFGPASALLQLGGGPKLRSSTVIDGSPAVRGGDFRVVLPRSSVAVQVKVRKLKSGAPSGTSRSKFVTTSVSGVSTRVLSITSGNQVVTISRSLLDVDHNLSRLRLLLVFISVGGVGAAAILGAFVSGRAVAPLRRLTETTERIVETGDLSQRTGQRGRDEISRLSTRLDELFASLEASLLTQRQLVADASHELRTPIATLRANIGLLAHPGTHKQARSHRAALPERLQVLPVARAEGRAKDRVREA